MRVTRPSVVIWLWLLSLCGFKLLLAHRLNLFGDEAFYWLEGQHLAWGYSDVPPLTAWLIAFSTALVGDSYLGVRCLFWALGCGLPCLVYLLARELGSARHALAAAALATAVPLIASMGVLAVPDVPLNVMTLCFAYALLRAVRGEGHWWWCWAGLAAALGWLSHVRFALPALAAVGFFLTTVTGRRLLVTPGPWLSAVIGILGLVPTLWFNWQHSGLSLRFQFQDRHPWSWQSEGLLQPLVQALVTTPWLYVLLLIVAGLAIARGRHRWPWALVAWFGALPPLVYFLLGLWADQERTSFHWPLAGYLVLAAGLPQALSWLRRCRMRRWASLPVRFVAAAGSGLGFASGLIVLLYLLLVSHWLQWRLPFGEIFPDNLVAWRAVATEAEAQRLSNEVLLADNFMLAAQLSFESGQPVPSLDHPLNVKHGRAGQLALWQLDETALPLLAGRDILLVVEETALDLVERQPWLARLCELFERVHIVAERSYYNRKRFLFYRLPAKGPKYCDRPSFAYVEQPMRAARVSGTIEVRGWAFEDDFGVAGVEIRLNDQPAGWAEYGLPMPAVRQFFPGLSDPSEPQLGFRALLDTTQWPDGEYWLSVRTYARDGGVRDSRARRLTITKASDTGP